MIYSSEADIVSFLKGLVQSLLPYAYANKVSLSFSSQIKKQVVLYQPFLLSQSVVQLICGIINLVPPKSEVEVRLLNSSENKNLCVEMENTGISLYRMNEIIFQNTYLFDVYPKPNGTLFRLVLPLQNQSSSPDRLVNTKSTSNTFPQFYAEIQKRLRSHFTEAEKHIATLEQSKPKEAAFMQRINALIKANLEDENFDTDSLCEAMSLSRTQLFRRVKSLVRQAPANYIKIIRLQRAKELLETTDLTVSEVVFKTGFQTLSHFTHIFQKQFGILPSVFRRSTNSATNE